MSEIEPIEPQEPAAKRRLERIDDDTLLAHRFYQLPTELKDKILKRVFQVKIYKKRINERKQVLKNIVMHIKLATKAWYEYLHREIPDELVEELRGLEHVTYKTLQPLSDFFEMANMLRVAIRRGVPAIPPQLARTYDCQMDLLRVTFDGHLRGDPDFYFDEDGMYHMIDDDIYFVAAEAHWD